MTEIRIPLTDDRPSDVAEGLGPVEDEDEEDEPLTFDEPLPDDVRDGDISLTEEEPA